MWWRTKPSTSAPQKLEKKRACRDSSEIFGRFRNEMSTQVWKKHCMCSCSVFCFVEPMFRFEKRWKKRRELPTLTLYAPSAQSLWMPRTGGIDRWLRLAPAPLFTTGEHRCFCICKADPALLQVEGAGVGPCVRPDAAVVDRLDLMRN